MIYLAKPFMDLKDDLFDFCKRKKVIIPLLLFFSLASFGFTIFNFSLKIDSENELVMASEKAYSNIDYFYINNGRFFIALLRILFSINGSFVPYVSTFFTVIWLALTALLWCVIFDKLLKNKVTSLSLIAFCGIFLSVPSFYSQIIFFVPTSDIICFAFLIITIAIYFLTFNFKLKSIAFIYSCLIVLAAFNTWQAFPAYFLVSFFVIILFNAIFNGFYEPKKIVSFAVPFVLCGIVGLAGYIFPLFLLKILGLKFTYIESMIGWSEGGLSSGIRHILGAVYKIFFSGTLSSGSIYTLLSLCIFVVMLIKTLIKKSPQLIFTIFLIFTLLLLSVFSLCIVLGSNMPYRTFSGLPLFLGSLWLFNLQSIRYNVKINSQIAITIIISIIWTFVFSRQVLLLNNLNYSAYQTAELDRTFSIQIAQDIIKNNNGIVPVMPVIFVGGYQVYTAQTMELDAVGGSILNWYEQIRKYNIMKVNGYYFNSSLVDSPEANARAQQEALFMPNWPAKDSIKFLEDLIVVKLSGPTLSRQEMSSEEFVSKNNNNPAGINQWIDLISLEDGNLKIYGWSYFVDKLSINTEMQIALVSDKVQYIMNINTEKRTDVDDVFNKNSPGEYSNSGINATLPLSSLQEGHYKLMLLLKNEKNASCIDLNKEYYINGQNQVVEVIK